jgi:hypothetical protein
MRLAILCVMCKFPTNKKQEKKKSLENFQQKKVDFLHKWLKTERENYIRTDDKDDQK